MSSTAQIPRYVLGATEKHELLKMSKHPTPTQVLYIWGRWTLAVSFTIPYQNQRNLSCAGHWQFPLQFLIKVNEI